MGTEKILYVGQDICRRIPVMESAGFTVIQSQNSASEIHSQLIKINFSAIAFQCNSYPPQDEMIRATRELSVAPLVLFENPDFQCDESQFDLVIPSLIQPSYWLKALSDVIEEYRQLCEWSRQVRATSENVRSESRELRAASEYVRSTYRALHAESRRRISPIDPDAPWRGDGQ